MYHTYSGVPLSVGCDIIIDIEIVVGGRSVRAERGKGYLPLNAMIRSDVLPFLGFQASLEQACCVCGAQQQ